MVPACPINMLTRSAAYTAPEHEATFSEGPGLGKYPSQMPACLCLM